MRFNCNLYDVDVFAVLWLQPHILRFQLLICRIPLLNSVVFVFVASCFFCLLRNMLRTNHHKFLNCANNNKTKNDHTLISTATDAFSVMLPFSMLLAAVVVSVFRLFLLLLLLFFWCVYRLLWRRLFHF